MHKQAINHKQAIIGGGYLFTENACFSLTETSLITEEQVEDTKNHARDEEKKSKHKSKSKHKARDRSRSRDRKRSHRSRSRSHGRSKKKRRSSPALPASYNVAKSVKIKLLSN